MPAYNESANIADTIHKWYPVVQRLNQTSLGGGTFALMHS